MKRRIETLDKKKSSPRVKKTKQECSDDDEDCAAPTCLRPTGNALNLEYDGTLVHRVRKRLYPFFIFFPRCPVCGEWCKLH